MKKICYHICGQRLGNVQRNPMFPWQSCLQCVGHVGKCRLKIDPKYIKFTSNKWNKAKQKISSRLKCPEQQWQFRLWGPRGLKRRSLPGPRRPETHVQPDWCFVPWIWAYLDPFEWGPKTAQFAFFQQSFLLFAKKQKPAVFLFSKQSLTASFINYLGTFLEPIESLVLLERCPSPMAQTRASKYLKAWT